MNMTQEELFNRRIIWRQGHSADFPFIAHIEGHRLKIRVNGRPKEPFYSLILEGEKLFDFDDWPELWRKQFYNPGKIRVLLHEELSNYTDRYFQLWDFSPSHGRLLIRSPQSLENSVNVDIIFFGVETIFLTPHMGEIHSIKRDYHDEIHGKFNIEASRASGWVVAANYTLLESSMDIFDSSLDFFPRWDEE